MASWDTVRVWLMVVCAGPLYCNVFDCFCLTISASLAERWDGSNLGGVLILLDGTTSAGNLWFGFTPGDGDRISVPVSTLVGFRWVTGGWENNGGVGRKCVADIPLSYLSTLFIFRMLPSVVSCSSVVSLMCSGRFIFSYCYILSMDAMTRSYGVTTRFVMYLCLCNTVSEVRVFFISFIHMI